ncbi:MAG: cell wall-binding repeat-containing protein [Rhodoglobus sp.]
MTVTAGATTGGINAELGTIPAVTGTVSYALPGGGTAPLTNAKVSFFRSFDSSNDYVLTDAQGRYVLPISTDYADFVLKFDAPYGSHLASEYWNNTPNYAAAELLRVAAGTFKYGFDAVLAREATLNGRVEYSLGTPTALVGATVTLYRSDSGAANFTYWDAKVTDELGNYAFSLLPVGDYKVKVTDDSPKDLGSQYWQGQKFLNDATPIALAEGQNLTLAAITLVKRNISAVRLAGPDRFSTSVAISEELFPGSSPVVPVVYIASGLNYPDALAAGPAAIKQGGGLLLVLPSAIPASVAAELERLKPQKIVLVGGTPSVNDLVKADLERFVRVPGDVIRIGGTDRFDTANKIARYAFGDGGASTAFFVTGYNFPDALAAGSAAGREHAPIILVNGNDPLLAPSTIDLMYGLGVSHAYVVGGTGTVSNGVENSIRSNLTPSGRFDTTYLSRLAGGDRYSTAVSVNGMWADSDVAIIATGSGFADALGGGTLAGALGVPLFLSPSNCVPQSVIGSLVRLQVNKVILLGGPATLTSSIEKLVACS